MADRQLAEGNRAIDGEHHGVDADSECERGERHRREARRMDERANGVAKIYIEFATQPANQS